MIEVSLNVNNYPKLSNIFHTYKKLGTPYKYNSTGQSPNTEREVVPNKYETSSK